MNFVKGMFGKILYGISRGLDIVLGFLIDFLEFIVQILEQFGRMLVNLVTLGCSIIFFMVPLGLIYLSPVIVRLLFIFIVVPFLAKGLRNLLSFLKFTVTEYLYDRSNYYIDGTKVRFSNIGDYGREYIRKEEEKKRKAEEERARRERERFEDMFRGFGGFNFNDFDQGGYYGTNQGYGPTNIGFKEKYEAAADILEVPYNASQEEIRKAYRNKAKQYHPDINKSPDATEQFQKINDANEMLSEENMMRYRNLI